MSTAWWYWADQEKVEPPQIAVELAEAVPEVTVDAPDPVVEPPVDPEPEVIPVVEVEATPLEELEELPQPEEYQAVRPWMPRGQRYRPSVPKPEPAPPPREATPEPAQPAQPQEAPKPATEEPVASVVLAPQIDAKQCPAPEYPRRARRMRWEGVTQLLVTVDVQGAPIAIVVQESSGHEMLDEAAILAVWEWHFHPAKRDGVAEQGDLLVPIRFQIVD